MRQKRLNGVVAAQEIEPDTFEILTEFDVAGEGYTLLLPFNQDKQGTPLVEAFPDLNSTATLAMADDIIRAHIIPRTLQYADIEELANATGEYTVESLQASAPSLFPLKRLSTAAKLTMLP